MALTYSSTIQDAVASTLFQAPYTNLSAQNKFRIDGGSSASPPTLGAAFQAWTKVQKMAQWWEFLGSDITSDAAYPWLIAEIAYIASMTVRVERTPELRDARNSARADYLDSLATIEIDDGYEAGVFTPTPAGIRFFVLRHCVKLDKPLLVSPQTIDAAMQDRLNWLWNKAYWSFKRRKLSAVIGVVNVTVATWTESTKTLTETGAFTNYPYAGAGSTTTLAGAMFRVSGGTNVVKGAYEVNTKTSADAITLKQSLSKIVGNLATGDITGNVVSVNVFGLQSGDRLDAIGTRELYIDGQERRTIEWATADELSNLYAVSDTTTGCPQKFRVERQGATLVWHFWPAPDQDYTVHMDGMLMIPGTATPGVPTSATDATIFSLLPNEFAVLVKDLTLGKILKDHGKGSKVLDDAEAEVDRYAPIYDEPGKPTQDGSIRDVYHDVEALTGNRQGLYRTYGVYYGGAAVGGPM